MEGGRKRASSGGIPAVLALIRDSFFYRLSAAVGGAIYRGAMNRLAGALAVKGHRAAGRRAVPRAVFGKAGRPLQEAAAGPCGAGGKQPAGPVVDRLCQASSGAGHGVVGRGAPGLRHHAAGRDRPARPSGGNRELLRRSGGLCRRLGAGRLPVRHLPGAAWRNAARQRRFALAAGGFFRGAQVVAVGRQGGAQPLCPGGGRHPFGAAHAEAAHFVSVPRGGGRGGRGAHFVRARDGAGAHFAGPALFAHHAADGGLPVCRHGLFLQAAALQAGAAAGGCGSRRCGVWRGAAAAGRADLAAPGAERSPGRRLRSVYANLLHGGKQRAQQADGAKDGAGPHALLLCRFHAGSLSEFRRRGEHGKLD